MHQVSAPYFLARTKRTGFGSFLFRREGYFFPIDDRNQSLKFVCKWKAQSSFIPSSNLLPSLLCPSVDVSVYLSAADPILLLLSNGFPVGNFSSSCDFGLCHKEASYSEQACNLSGWGSRWRDSAGIFHSTPDFLVAVCYL